MSLINLPAFSLCLLAIISLRGCGKSNSDGFGNATGGPEYGAFGTPSRVTISGYDGDAMEPFISQDGRFLFFNNSNDPDVDTNLHYAERVDDNTFTYRGEIAGINSDSLEGVPTMDRNNRFFFVSTRNYEETLSTIYQGTFGQGAVSNVGLLSEISEQIHGHVNFDVEISPDGTELYFVDGIFSGGPIPESADLAIARREGSVFRRRKDSDHLLKNVNTDALEYAACISADGLELFFTRLDKSKKAVGIHRSSRSNTSLPFGPAERVAAARGFVEAPTLSADGKSLYFHKKEGARFVIYRIAR